MSASAATPLPPGIASFLGRTRRRLRLRRGATGALYGLAIGLAAGTLLALVARLWPLFLPQQLLIGIGALAGAGIALGGLAGIARPLPLREVAGECDRSLGLRERVSTALELASGRAHSALARLQLEETAAQLAEHSPREARLPRPDQRLLVAIGALLALQLLLLVAPNRQTEALQTQAANRQVLQQAAQQVSQIQAQVQARDDLDPEVKRALEQQLAQLQKELTDGTLDRAEAVARIAAVEAELRRLQDPNAARDASGLPKLADELKTIGVTADAGQRLAAGDYAGAGQALKALGDQLPGLDPGSRAALSQKLRDAAASQAATNPELAQQLQDAADALARGDTEAAQAALDRAGDLLAQTGQQAATQGQLSQTLGDLSQIKQGVATGQTPSGATANATPQPPAGSPVALSGSPIALNGSPVASNPNGTPVNLSGTPVVVGTPRPGQNGTPVAVQGQGQGQAQAQGQGQQGQGQGQGQGQAQAQGQGQGQAQGQGQGQQGGTSSSQGNSSQGGGGSGGGAGSSGSGSSQQTPIAGATGQQPPTGQGRPNPGGNYEPVYAPNLPGGTPGQQQQGPGGAGGAGSPPSATTQGPGANSPSSVPYNQVYQNYLDQALKGLDDGSIPPELRDYIRQYFSDLDPNAKK